MFTLLWEKKKKAIVLVSKKVKRALFFKTFLKESYFNIQLSKYKTLKMFS